MVRILLRIYSHSYSTEAGNGRKGLSFSKTTFTNGYHARSGINCDLFFSTITRVNSSSECLSECQLLMKIENNANHYNYVPHISVYYMYTLPTSWKCIFKFHWHVPACFYTQTVIHIETYGMNVFIHLSFKTLTQETSKVMAFWCFCLLNLTIYRNASSN